MQLTGTVFNIQRFSLHDGAGIRTVVFLKGCPLRCRWCCNPESWQARPEIMYIARKCVRCGRCVSACPRGAIGGPGTIDRGRCTACGSCQRRCPAQALYVTGRRMDVREVLQEVEKDRPFFETSGGGVTLSGGEPLLQWEFALELLSGCRASGMHTALETTGYADEDALLRCAARADQILYDIKGVDEELHVRNTGSSNVRIIGNLRRLCSEGFQVIARVPVVPGHNMGTTEVERLGELLCSLGEGVKEVHLLPFHQLGSHKYAALNLEYPLENEEGLLERDVEGVERYLGGLGLKVRTGG